MGRDKNLINDQIAAVTSLCKAKQSNKEISKITGINLRSVQRWAKKFRDSINGEVALQGKSTVRAREIGSRTLTILMREVENNPSLIAR